MSTHLIEPHGGSLVDLIATRERQEEIKTESRDWSSWDLTPRQLCDLELLLNGGFSPLTGFLGRADYDAVCADMRLASGILWPIPITLDLPETLAKELSSGRKLALRDPEGVMLAVLHVEDVWQPDRDKEVESVFGTTNREHPAVAYTLDQANPCYVGGRLEGLQAPSHYDFRALRFAPKRLREEFTRLGWRKIVAFQTRNPMHRAHHELTLRAAKEVEANLLIHPVVGMTKPGDLDHYTRVRCYQAIAGQYPANTARLSLLPLAMRMGGPREAVWHAIIRKNYGCTHLIVGRDHAGPGSDSSGKPFYGPYDAQELLQKHEEELGVAMVPFKMMVYLEDKDTYMPQDEVPEGGARFQHLRNGAPGASRDGKGLAGMVHVSGSGHGAQTHASSPKAARFHRFLHGPLGLGEIHRRERAAREASRDGRTTRHASRRRSRTQKPVLGARLLQRASRYQHPPYRLRRFGDHEEQRHRDLRSHRTLRFGA